MSLKFRGNYSKLKKSVLRTGFDGEWRDLKNHHKQYRTDDGGILNWWKTSGTITFQGHGSAANQLEEAFIAVASAKGRIETDRCRSLKDQYDEFEALRKSLANALIETNKISARMRKRA
jgi:hypothetical protein